MSSQTATSRDTASGSEQKPLLMATAGLLALLLLNLVLFDDLRTDASATFSGTLLKPQHLTSILACLLAVILIAIGHRSARRVAAVVAWIEIVAFVFFHGIPFEIGPSKPYWGEGMGDGLQWLGFVLILACSAAVMWFARSSSRATGVVAV